MDGQISLFDCFGCIEEVESAMKNCPHAKKLGGCRIKNGRCTGYVTGCVGSFEPAPPCYICKYNEYYDSSHIAKSTEEDIDDFE